MVHNSFVHFPRPLLSLDAIYRVQTYTIDRDFVGPFAFEKNMRVSKKFAVFSRPKGVASDK